jgi:hypothetical protein
LRLGPSVASKELVNQFPHAESSKLTQVSQMLEAVKARGFKIRPATKKAVFYIVSAMGADNDNLDDWLANVDDFVEHEEVSNLLEIMSFNFIPKGKVL